MSRNLDKLKGHSDIKQDINRRQSSDVNGKESNRLNKRINDIAKVIADPDVWNVNISSRDRMDKMEQRVEELERRMNGMAHVMRSIAFNRRLVDEDIQAIEDRVDDDNNISGSSE
jgi:enoyl-[acyl-carrier-protein] reductase (NADH)